MVVCQYFLERRCRFGQNCRNEHIYNNSSGNRGGRNSGNNHISNIVWQISNEVIANEKGGQWPLSSFAPIKDGPCLPGWVDVSPEEVRWTLYEAQKNGTVNQALNQINQLYKNAENARNLLKQPTAEVTNLLNDILKGKKSVHSSGGGSANFGSPANDPKTTFRFDTAITNIFGKPANPDPGSRSIFGGSSSSSSNNGVFQNQNIFGQPQPPPPTNNSPSIFTRPQQPNQQNIFSNAIQSQNVFAPKEQNQSPFSRPASNQNIFQNQMNGDFFPGPDLSAQDNTDVFKNAQANPFQFQSPNPPQPLGPTGPENNSFPPNPIKEVDTTMYSKMDDLNEEEIKSFNSKTFAFGKIPLKPPPQNFCLNKF